MVRVKGLEEFKYIEMLIESYEMEKEQWVAQLTTYIEHLERNITDLKTSKQTIVQRIKDVLASDEQLGQVLQYKYIGGLTHKKIAEYMGVSERTVGRLLDEASELYIEVSLLNHAEELFHKHHTTGVK